MTMNKNILRWLFYSLLTIIFIPQVLAYRLRTGISPLDRAFEAIGQVFNIQILQSNSVVQEGFIRFMLFIVLFAVANMSLKRLGKGGGEMFDKKTAGIISFAFSMIGVFMMPRQWLLATGGLITVIMSSIIFVGFFIGLGVVAVFVLRQKEGDPPMIGWIKNLLGLLLILLLIFLIDEWAALTGLPLMVFIREAWIKKLFKLKKK